MGRRQKLKPRDVRELQKYTDELKSVGIFTPNSICISDEKGIQNVSEITIDELQNINNLTSDLQTSIDNTKTDIQNISNYILNDINNLSTTLQTNIQNFSNFSFQNYNNITLDDFNSTQNIKFIENNVIKGDLTVQAWSLNVSNLNKIGNNYNVKTEIIDGTSLGIMSDSLSGPALNISHDVTNKGDILNVNVQNENKMKITSSGFVGISNDAPTTELDIQGDIKFSGTINNVSSQDLLNLSNLQTNIQQQIDDIGDKIDTTGSDSSLANIQKYCSDLKSVFDQKTNSVITESSQLTNTNKENASNLSLLVTDYLTNQKQDEIIFNNNDFNYDADNKVLSLKANLKPWNKNLQESDIIIGETNLINSNYLHNNGEIQIFEDTIVKVSNDTDVIYVYDSNSEKQDTIIGAATSLLQASSNFNSNEVLISTDTGKITTTPLDTSNLQLILGDTTCNIQQQFNDIYEKIINSSNNVITSLENFDTNISNYVTSVIPDTSIYIDNIVVNSENGLNFDSSNLSYTGTISVAATTEIYSPWTCNIDSNNVSYLSYSNINVYNDEIYVQNIQDFQPTIVSNNSNIELNDVIVNQDSYMYSFTQTEGHNYITFPVDINVDVFMVGGGGSGGGNNGYGGEGGEIKIVNLNLQKNVTYDVTVGKGGIASLYQKGGTSYAFGEISRGGNAGLTSSDDYIGKLLKYPPTSLENLTSSELQTIEVLNGSYGNGVYEYIYNNDYGRTNVYNGTTYDISNVENTPEFTDYPGSVFYIKLPYAIILKEISFIYDEQIGGNPDSYSVFGLNENGEYVLIDNNTTIGTTDVADSTLKNTKSSVSNDQYYREYKFSILSIVGGNGAMVFNDVELYGTSVYINNYIQSNSSNNFLPDQSFALPGKNFDVTEQDYTPILRGTYNNGSFATENNVIYEYAQFTADGTITFPKDTVCDILMVGGGGSGSAVHGGGGGAGKLILVTDVNISAETYTINIGKGGICSTDGDKPGNKGGNTEFKLSDTILCYAEGGGGAGRNDGGEDGGSGAGGDAYATQYVNGNAIAYSPVLFGISGIALGNDGGNFVNSSGAGHGGGGGGAGTIGQTATGGLNTGTSGKGGDGVYIVNGINLNNAFDLATNNLGVNDGTGNYYLAGGGGGGKWGNATTGIGGKGGGGIGGDTTYVTPQPNNVGGNGIANTGSGGGGGGDGNNLGGSGGSGLFVIRWKKYKPILNLVDLVDVSGVNVENRQYSEYEYAEFKSDGEIIFNKDVDCDIFMIGGGGGGGYNHSGGGGAGAYRLEKHKLNGHYYVTVGQGGNGGTSSVSASNGTISKISNESFAISVDGGGGGGGGGGQIGSDGGCGGGGNGWDGNNTGSRIYAGGKATGNGIGFNGGSGVNNYSGQFLSGGGGGGIGSIGKDPVNKNGGDGGDGLIIGITGSKKIYGGGGAGGTWPSYGSPGRAGGAMLYGVYVTVGGNATNTEGQNGGDGVENTGSGGGSGKTATGGNGGSGIVIIRWKKEFIIDGYYGSGGNGGIVNEIGESGNDGIVAIKWKDPELLYKQRVITENDLNNIQGKLTFSEDFIYNESDNSVGLKKIKWNTNDIFISNRNTRFFDNEIELSQGDVYVDTISTSNIKPHYSSPSMQLGNNAEIHNPAYSENVIKYDDEEYEYVEFTENGKISFSQNVVCDVLVVGGGGSGGTHIGGGGGAGGVVYVVNNILHKGEYTINVGKGGAKQYGSTGSQVGNNGENSSIKLTSTDEYVVMDNITLLALGGGGGGSYLSTRQGNNGGSGGGSGDDYNIVTNGGNSIQGNTYWNGVSYISGGNDGRTTVGGTIDDADQYRGSGGGGMGTVGTTTPDGHNGYNGIQNTITGSVKYYAAGGGGGTNRDTGYGLGGAGIGGNGANNKLSSTSVSIVSATDGVDGTGSGGGGGGYNNNSYDNRISGAGGSGVVIIRWKKEKEKELLVVDTDTVVRHKINGYIDNIVSTSGDNVTRNETEEFEYAEFKTDGTIFFHEDIKCDVLVVGGGGGGGHNGGGGGGGGQVKYYTDEITSFKTGEAYSFTTGTYMINIGSGGSAGTSDNTYGGNGGTSSIVQDYDATTVLTAGGGGGGGGKYIKGAIGVGGGGGGGHGGSYTGGLSTGDGGPGGNAYSGRTGGGGGGGANVANKNGGNGTSSQGGSGGVGVNIDIVGASQGYGGGGGGGTWDIATQIVGTEGGGNGATRYQASSNGMSGTGGGGGGGGHTENTTAGDGGSGIVIIRWKKHNKGIYYSYISENNIKYDYIEFKSDAKISFSKDVVCDVLVVGGGGGGGGTFWRGGGGGGGGQVKYLEQITFPKSTDISISIGAGGDGGAAGTSTNAFDGTNGSPTTITYNSITIIAEGGGGGAQGKGGSIENGLNGASGGGGCGTNVDNNGSGGLPIISYTTSPSTYTGYEGGSGGTWYLGGGGGGYGGRGGNADTNGGGTGGIGINNSITGTSLGYGGGGGGGAIKYSGNTYFGGNASHRAGTGGGYGATVYPNSSQFAGFDGNDAIPGSGSGGGGASTQNPVSVSVGQRGGNGGSGIVIIRWKHDPTLFTSYCLNTKKNIWFDESTVVYTSDERVKKEIKDIDDEQALQKILGLQPKTYKYIDHLNKGNNDVYGFISQQVRDVFPEATNTISNYIPNIYDICEYANDIITIPENIDISTLGLSSGTNSVKLINQNKDSLYRDFVLKELETGGYGMQVRNIDDFVGNTSKIFVYGTKVDDMVTLDKSYLFTLNVCATQILNRKINTLEQKNMALLTRIDELENELSQIEISNTSNY